jgi:hypothetical protein
MKTLTTFTTLAFAILSVSCNVKHADVGSQESIPLEGTWELISETKIEKDDTTYSAAGKDKRMIKIINKTHFSFLNHDLNQGKDSSALFVAGGGRYTLKDDQYTEHLDYCNFREWENHDFSFKVNIKNDTLTQRGTEKVEGLNIDRIIIEKYRRIE